MRLMDEANFAGRHLTHEQLRLRARGLGALIPDAMGGSTGRATDAPGIQMSRTRTLPLVALIAILSANTILGEPHDPEVVAARTDRPPVIDGDLSDGVWVQASPSADFRQREPEEGGVPSEGTEVRVLYDDRHLYFALRCFDSEPERITATRMRRDGGLDEDDHVQIVLDTYDNRRGGYLFRTNPLGAQFDALLTDEGRTLNDAWNAVWACGARRDSLGWTAELSIPFDQLRYPDSDEARWGINVGRTIKRRNEEIFLLPPPQSFGFRGGQRTSQLAALTGLGRLQRRSQREVVPYLLTGTQRAFEGLDSSEDPFVDIGADVKIGVSRGLTLDLSYNTDFAQVESDRAEVNLTRFSLFFPEKRSFFLEGAGIFAVGERQGRLSDRPPTVLFYSRRIGIQEGHEVPVSYGAKLSGRVGSWEIGALNMMTEPALFRDEVEEDRYLTDSGVWLDDDDLDELDDAARGGLSFVDTVTAEMIDTVDVERTLFNVLRVKRDILGRSSVGLMLTDKNPGEEGDYNRALGVDANLSFHEGSTNLTGFAAQTWTPGSQEANRAWYLEFDRRAGDVELSASYLDVGDDFDPEIGFVPRTDIRRLRSRLRYRPRPDTPWVRRYSTGVEWLHLLDRDNGLQTREVRGSFFLQTEAGDWIGIQAQERFERLDDDFEIHDDIDISVGDYTFREVGLRLFLSSKRRLGGRLGLKAGDFFDGSRRRVDAEATWKASDRFNLESKYEVNQVQLPAGDFIAQRVSERVLWTLSPEFYVRGLFQWDSQRHVVGGNVLLSYRYRPGSDLFVVYNHVWDTEPALHQLNRSLQLKTTYFWQP